MAELVCDICGGKLSIGSGSVATCDSCGIQHTKERMQEKIQEIKGTVKIDNSHMIDNWMRMGISATKVGKYKEAYVYFTKIIEIDPANWRAIFERGKIALRQSDSGISEFNQSIDIVLNIISGIKTDEPKLVDIKNEIALEVFNSRHTYERIIDKIEPYKKNFKDMEEVRHKLEIRRSYQDEMYRTIKMAKEIVSDIDISKSVLVDIKTELAFEAFNIYKFDFGKSTTVSTIITNMKEIIEKKENVISRLIDFEDKVFKQSIITLKKQFCKELCDVCGIVGYSFNFNTKDGQKLKEVFIRKWIELTIQLSEIDQDFDESSHPMIDPFYPSFRLWYHKYDEFLPRDEEGNEELGLDSEPTFQDRGLGDFSKEKEPLVVVSSRETLYDLKVCRRKQRSHALNVLFDFINKNTKDEYLRKYWSSREQGEQQRFFEQEKNKLKEKIAVLKAENPNFNRKQKLQEIEEKVETLKKEQSNTSFFFNGKRREVLQGQINDLKNEWYNLRYFDQENKLKEIESLVQIKVLRDLISVFDNEIKRINDLGQKQ